MNWRLWVGAFMTLGLMFISVAGPTLAPYEDDYSEKIVVHKADGRIVEMEFPPRPPSAEHPFGTDRWGYDILSRMLYGARYTVAAALGVAVARIVVAAALGSGLGMNSMGRVGRTVGAAGGIPAFLVVYFVLAGMTMNSPLSANLLFALQGAVMVVVGVPGLVGVMYERVISIRRSPHVTAAVSLGAGKARIARRHVLPFLRSELSILVVGETVLVLNLIGQLGIFHLFLGGTIHQTNPDIFLSRTSEWAGLLGQARGAVIAYPWVVLFPLLGFFFAALALFFLMRGLEVRRRQSIRQVSAL